MDEDETKGDYRSREHDHLVEPMFGGLGMQEEARPKPQCFQEESERGGLAALWLRVRRWLGRLVRPSRPASGR